MPLQTEQTHLNTALGERTLNCRGVLTICTKYICFLFVCLCVLCLGGTSDVFAGEESKGDINWVEGYVSGIGQGTAEPSGNKVKDRLKAIRAAEVLAFRSLAEMLKGVRIDGETVVENMMLRDDVVRARVEGMVKGAQKVKVDVSWEDNIPLATVEMRICLTLTSPECKNNSSSLMSSLLLEKKKAPTYVPAAQFAEPPAPKVKKETVESPKVVTPSVQGPVYDSSKPVSGVIFSLGGRPFERELLPVVITADGDKYLTVYSAKSVKPNIIRTYGVVRYSDVLDQAKSNQNLGDNVMIIQAADITKENMIVIGMDSARAIKETTRHGNDYLGDAKVVISAN